MTEQLLTDILDIVHIADVYYLQDQIKGNMMEYLKDDEDEIFSFLQKYYSNNIRSNTWNQIPEKYKKDRNFVIKCLKFKNIPYMEEYKDDPEIGLKMYVGNLSKLLKSKLIEDDIFMSKFIYEIKDGVSKMDFEIFIDKIDQKYQKIILKNLNIKTLGYTYSLPECLNQNRTYCLLIFKANYKVIGKTDWCKDEDFIIELLDSVFKDWEGKCTPDIFNYCLLNEK